MKGFIAAVITLSLLIGGIIWNGIYIHRTTGELIRDTETIENSTEDTRVDLLDELHKKWIKVRPVLAITVSHTEIEAIGSRIAALSEYAKTEDDSEFLATLAQLREDLEFLHRSEALTLEGII